MTAHFVEKFSSVLSGAACPVAVDDEKKKIRHSSPSYASIMDWYLDVRNIGGEWQDYPESHHVN
jgi:hypothetical protein